MIEKIKFFSAHMVIIMLALLQWSYADFLDSMKELSQSTTEYAQKIKKLRADNKSKESVIQNTNLAIELTIEEFYHPLLDQKDNKKLHELILLNPQVILEYRAFRAGGFLGSETHGGISIFGSPTDPRSIYIQPEQITKVSNQLQINAPLVLDRNFMLKNIHIKIPLEEIERFESYQRITEIHTIKESRQVLRDVAIIFLPDFSMMDFPPKATELNTGFVRTNELFATKSEISKDLSLYLLYNLVISTNDHLFYSDVSTHDDRQLLKQKELQRRIDWNRKAKLDPLLETNGDISYKTKIPKDYFYDTTKKHTVIQQAQLLGNRFKYATKVTGSLQTYLDFEVIALKAWYDNIVLIDDYEPFGYVLEEHWLKVGGKLIFIQSQVTSNSKRSITVEAPFFYREFNKQGEAVFEGAYLTQKAKNAEINKAIDLVKKRSYEYNSEHVDFLLKYLDDVKSVESRSYEDLNFDYNNMRKLLISTEMR